MKKIIYSVLTLLLIVGSSSCHEKNDIEIEMEAIKAVIEEETNAYIERDYDRFASTYVQDKTFIRIDARKSDYDYIVGWGYDYIVEWEEMRTVFTEDFNNNPDSLHYKFENTNYKIKVYPESAWAVYDENWYNINGEFVRLNISVRFLEKVNEDWKIVYLSGLNTTSYDEED